MSQFNAINVLLTDFSMIIFNIIFTTSNRCRKQTLYLTSSDEIVCTGLISPLTSTFSAQNFIIM
jgi:hypothetical protein